MEKVKIIEHKGEIAAQIPFELAGQANDLKLGQWEPKWQAWRFPYGPYAAYQLCWHFRDHIGHIDPSIKDMAAAMYQANQIKEMDQAPEIEVPGLRSRLWNHQHHVVSYAENIPAVALNLHMGCISGDAEISVNRAGITRKVKLRDLYLRFNNLDSRKKTRKPHIKWTCRSLKGDRFGNHEIERVLYKGQKDTIMIKLEDGKEIQCTHDHEIATNIDDTGITWKRADNLRTGNNVLVNGAQAKPNTKCCDCGKDLYIPPCRRREANDYRCRRCNDIYSASLKENHWSYKGGKFTDKDGYVRVHAPNHPRSNRSGHVYEHILVMENKIRRSVKLKETIHHKNEIKSDNREENLELLDSQKAHTKKHDVYKHLDGGTAGTGGKIIIIPKQSKIKSIQSGGKTDVYDIVMKDPWRNFVANSIVVHNCGKSLCSLALLQLRPHEKNLIICPKSVMDVWPHEFEKHMASSYQVCVPKKGNTTTRAHEAEAQLNIAKTQKKPYVLVINYESFWREKFFEFITSLTWDNIIYDEIQKIKDASGRAAKAAHKLVKKSKYRLGLTGTLIPHSFIDVFSIYKALSPDVFGTSFYRFRNMFAEMGGYGGKQVVGVNNAKELNNRIEAISIQVKSDVLELPEAIHTFRTVELSKKTWKVYKELADDLYAEIEQGEITVDNAMVKVLRLQQLTGGYLKTDDNQLVQYGSEKKELLSEVLDEFPKNEPLIIFARFTADIAEISEVCEKAGRTHGELSGHKNQLKEFQSGEIDILICQVQSGSVGIDLTRAAYCIYYSIGHSLANYEQSLARTNRPGQTRTVTYYHLLAKDTVDEQVYKALRQRKKVVEYILEGVKQEAEMEA